MNSNLVRNRSGYLPISLGNLKAQAPALIAKLWSVEAQLRQVSIIGSHHRLSSQVPITRSCQGWMRLGGTYKRNSRGKNLQHAAWELV